MLMSIVSPVYKGEKMLDELVARITKAVVSITDNYEIILINDCSPDDSWKKIEAQCARDPHVKGLDLSRNFGQHNAISAGLLYCRGEWVIVMDCDLQDCPEEIPNLYEKAQEGWDIVLGRRKERHDKFLKKLSSALFHKVFDWMSGLRTDKAVANFGIYRKCVIEAYNTVPERTRTFPALVAYLGFKTTSIEVRHAERAEGKSSYSFSKLLKLSYDTIISNSNKPLRITVGMGFVMSAFSFILALYNVIAKLSGLIQVPGYTTTIFSIWFVGGMILFGLGILGLYIGKTFDQVKGRPFFVVRKKLNIEKE